MKEEFQKSVQHSIKEILTKYSLFSGLNFVENNNKLGLIHQASLCLKDLMELDDILISVMSPFKGKNVEA
jgi:hypothetical protein